MLVPNPAALVFLLLLPFYTSASAVASSALALLRAQKDTKLIAALVNRDPELVKLYSTVQNATIAVAVDSSFPITDPNSIVYSNRAFLRDILRDIVIEGVYPTNAITKKPKYASTKLSNPRVVNTSRGKAVAKLVEVAGKKTVDVGGGTPANITQGNLRFKGGILHKVSNPLNTPASFFSIAARTNITAISTLPNGLSANFDSITGQRDTTLFSITNEAYEASKAGQPEVTLTSFVNTLAYYVVTPGVYFEEDFTGKTVKALNGAKLTLSGFGTGTTKVNGVKVVKTDIFASNGVLHILEGPISPAPN